MPRFSCRRASLLAVIVSMSSGGTRAGRVDTVQGVAACSASHRFCYGAPQNLGPLINTPQFDGGPSISADGLTLYFTSGRPGGLGQAEGHYDEDLYLSTRLTVGDPFGARYICLHRSTARSSTLRPKSLQTACRSISSEVRVSTCSTSMYRRD